MLTHGGGAVPVYVTKALSTVHMAIGLVTYGTMTWAGTIFLF